MDRTLRAPADAGPRVGLLDGFTVRGDRTADGPGEELPRTVQRVVAHLCLVARAARASVCGVLWPDVPEDRAQASLRSALWRLRRAAPGLVEGTGGTLRLAAGVGTDVRELQSWAGQVCDPRTGPDRVALPAPALLGDLLPGWYDDWVLLERDRLAQLRLHALEATAARLAAAGRHAEALQAAYLAIRAEPLRESAHRTVVRVHLAEGNVAEALRAHDSFRDLLREELGVPPTERMTALVRGITLLRRPATPRTAAPRTAAPAPRVQRPLTPPRLRRNDLRVVPPLGDRPPGRGLEKGLA